MVDLSVVIVSWNVAGPLRDCLGSLGAGAPGLLYEVVVVDNASTDGSAEMVAQEFPAVRLIRCAENLGFARANNLAIAGSSGRYVLLLNPDTVVPPGSVASLARFMDEHPSAGACGPRLVQADGAPQSFAFGGDPAPLYLLARAMCRLVFHKPLHDWQAARPRRVDWVSGACLLVRRAAIEEAGLLDERIFMYFEDNDWCLRLRQRGWSIFHNPAVAITHLCGRSLAQNSEARRAYRHSLAYFYAKHYGLFARAMLRLALAADGRARKEQA